VYSPQVRWVNPRCLTIPHYQNQRPMIETNRLQLRPITPAGFEAILSEDSRALSTFLQVRVAADWLAFQAAREAIPFAAQFLKKHPEAAQWWSYFFIHKPSNTLIGLGGFSGSPSAEGVVEIGYSIAPSYQRQGCATEAARGLVEFALADPAVNQVVAHTLPAPNGSTSVLTKIGFRFQDVVNDPQEGSIWAWRLERSDYPANV